MERKSNSIYLVGIGIIVFFATFVAAGLLSLLLHIPISAYTAPCSLLLFFVANAVLLKWYSNTKTSASIGFSSIATAVICLCFLWAKPYHENFFDAVWYHHDAVYQLAKGWNPYDRNLRANETSYCEFYLNYFPKGYWIFGAIIYSFTHTIEAAKGMDLALILACAMILCGGLLKQNFGWSNAKSVFVGLLISLNPIAIINAFSFYVDGPIASLLSLGIFFSLAQWYGKENKAWLLAFICFGVLFHLKYTGTAFSILFMGAFFVLLIMKEKWLWKKWLMRFSIFSILVLLILGFHPFISNTIHKGHPFFPAVENNEIKVFKLSSYPADFIGKDRFTKFATALFAETGWHGTPDKSTPKELFSFIGSEFYGKGIPDLGALGPLFAEFFSLSIIAFIISFLFLKNRKRKFQYLLGFIFFLFTFFINQEAWVFRYIPHLWLLSILMLLPLWEVTYGKYFSIIIMLGLYINSGIVSKEAYKGQSAQSNQLNKTFDFLKGKEDVYAIYHGWGNSFLNRMGENGIDTSKWVWIHPLDTPYTSITGSLDGKYKLRKDLHLIK